MTGKLGHHPPSDFPAPLRWLAAVSRFLAVVEGIGIGVCLVAVVLLAVYTCITHNMREHGQVWWPQVPTWADGTIRHGVFILGLLGGGYATYTARHLRVDAVTRLAPPFPRLFLRVLTTIAVLVLFYFMIKGSILFRRDLLAEDTEVTMQGELFNSSRGAAVLVGGLGIIAFHFLVQLALDLVWILRWKTPPADWIAEAHGADAPPTTGQELVEPIDPEPAKGEVRS